MPALVHPKIGLIGCGFIGRFHSRNIRAIVRSERLPAQYVAVCDREPARADEFAAITGAASARDAGELLQYSGLNTVYICAETSEHPALVLEAARRGLAIFCEKPLARTLAEAQRMVTAVEAAGVTNQVGLVLRYSPVYTVLAELMRQPGLGPLLTAHLRDDQFFPIRGHYASAWRGDIARAGGGTLLEHSIHDLDLFRWLFGEITSVRCQTRVTSGHPGIEDVALATFQHQGGSHTSLSSVWHAIDGRPSTRRLEVFFEGGWFVTDHDFVGPIHYQLRQGPELELSADQVLEHYRRLAGLDEDEMWLASRGMVEDYRFLQAVAAGGRAFPDFRTALRAHQLVDACYRSAASGQDVTILPS